MKNKIIFIFLDGFGLGDNSEANPLANASMPFLKNILDGRMINKNLINKNTLLLKGIDACLGVKGIPQSATGQTALFTGENAAKKLGFHLPAFPNRELREVINNSNYIRPFLGYSKR